MIMKVVFLQRDSFVKISIELLSGILKQNGHACELYIESGENQFLSSALSSGADLFAFSCTTGGEQWVYDTAERLKKQTSTPIIVGGPHTTFFPQMIHNPHIDYICRGEGEEALLELLSVLHRPDAIRQIRNIWSKDLQGNVHETEVRPFFRDLDNIPLPDFGIYTKYPYMTPYNLEMFPVMTGRGCPFACSYCFNKAYRDLYRKGGRYLRKRSPEVMIEELVRAKKKWGVKKINFVDDSFFLFPKWFEEFYPLYIKHVNLPFIINVEATHVKDDLVKKVSEMGCICVRMGVETGNDTLRKEVLNKKVNNEQIRRAAASIKKYGMNLSTYNMLGLPGETFENAMETYQLNREIGTNFAQCSLLQPYPGTKINDYVREMGIYGQTDREITLNASFFATSKIILENEREITNLQKLMQVFIQMKVPASTVRKIVKLPENLFFHYVFRLSFIIGKIKNQHIKLIPLIRLGLHSLSYMK